MILVKMFDLRRGVACASVIFVSFIVLTNCSLNKQSGDPFACNSLTDNPNITLISENKEYPSSHFNNTWPNFKELKLQCKAAYPIQWEFDGNRPTDVRFYAELKVDNPLSITKKCYTVTLSTHGYGMQETRTGNYTCRGLTDKTKVSSLFKYIQDREDIIFSAVKSLNVTVNADKNARTIIPCASNVPDLVATLMSIDENGNITALRNDIWRGTYNPQVGFSIASNESIVGKYVCSATHNNVSDVIEASISRAPDVITEPKGKFVTFSNGKLSVSCEGNEPVEIRLANPVSGVSSVSKEYTPDTNNYKYGASADLITTSTDAQGEITCVDKNTKSIIWTWKFDAEYSCTCNWSGDTGSIRYRDFDGLILHDRAIRSHARKYRVKDRDLLYPDEPRGEIICHSIKSPEVNLTFLPCGNPAECKIQSSCFKFGACPLSSEYSSKGDSDEEDTDTESVGTKINMRLRAGILKCTAGDYTTTKVAVSSLDALYFDEIPKLDLLRIVAPENHSFAGDTLLFSCHASSFQLTKELRWAFQFKNNSVQFIDVDTKDEKTGHDLQKLYRSSFIKVVSSDVGALLCFAPVWNSSAWMNTSFPLIIADAVAVETNSPASCEVSTSPIIILQRNSSVSTKRMRVPHIVSNKIVTIYEPVDTLKLICRANYPVEWVYDGTKMNSTKINKVSCNSGSVPSKKVYEAVLNINRLHKESTGNYTCRKTLQTNPQAYVYIYAVGDGEASFVNEGHHVQIEKSEADSNPWVTMPCRVSNPDSKPYLFLDHEDSERVQRLELGENLKYDPTFGFSMHISLAPQPMSIFICSVDENATDFGMLITLSKTSEPVELRNEVLAAASQGYGNGVFIAVTLFMIGLVIVLIVGLVFMYRKLKQGPTRNGSVEDGHKMENTDVFAAYDDDIPVQNEDTENIVDGYHRF